MAAPSSRRLTKPISPSVSVVNQTSHPLQLPHPDLPRLRRDQIPQTIRRVIAADAFLIGIHFEHILWPVWIVLQRRQRLNQSPTSPMNEQRRAVAQALGAVRNRTALEPLILSLADEEPAVRHAAAAALEAIDPRWVRTDAARRAVLRLEALRADPRPWIVAAAERVLEKLRSSSDSSTETWKRESGIRTL